MLFTSFRYIVFLAIIVLLYWKLPNRFNKVFLLIASYLFYMDWFPQYGLLILLQTTITYWLGILIADATDRRRRMWLLMAIGFNLGVLCSFKYTDFVLHNLQELSLLAGHRFSFHVNILLPLGISFFTFEFIHYIVDVYKGNPPVRDYLGFALFPAFFPTQIAGPIKRYEDFIPQISAIHEFTTERCMTGMRLIVRGLFKKIVLADNLSTVVQTGFGSPEALGAFDAWIVVLAFSLQIYFDFSGYTDIARGSAFLLGYNVPENFNMPYLASSISNFWQRWHMSLSSWLKDYLYIPLGGNRCSVRRKYLNLFLTMTLAGLWHGAAWTFVIWGAFHGMGLVVHREWERINVRFGQWRHNVLWRFTAWSITIVFVCVGWIFFRAPTLAGAWEMIERITFFRAPRLIGSLDPDHWLTTIIILAGYGAYLIHRSGIASKFTPAWIYRDSYVGQTLQMAVMISVILAFPGGQASFIYFQF